jgi:hypothetical protein
MPVCCSSSRSRLGPDLGLMRLLCIIFLAFCTARIFEPRVCEIGSVPNILYSFVHFVPEGQPDSSQARSAWDSEENSPVPAGRLKP